MALARASDAVNLAVAIICMVLVMRWMVRTATMRWLIVFVLDTLVVDGRGSWKYQVVSL